jgi:ribosomal protein S27AE
MESSSIPDRVERERQRQLKRSKRWAKEHPDAIKAHRIVWVALKSGKIQRPDTCPACGKKGWIAAHHEDYSKPLDIHWLCGPCHKAIHRNRSVDGSRVIPAAEFIAALSAPNFEPGRYYLTRYGLVWRVVTVYDPSYVKTPSLSLNAPAPAAPAPVVEPEPVEPVVELAPEVVPALAAPAVGNASRLAALLARGRATVAPAPADLPDDPAPAVPAMSQRQWARLDPDARVRWVRLNLPNITDDDELAEWLACLPK